MDPNTPSLSNLEDENNPDYYYSILGIPKKANSDEIRTAYRRLCVIYHPDKHLDPSIKTAAHHFFSLLHRAYSTLIDTQLRSIYDQFGRKGVEAAMQLSPLIENDIERLKRALLRQPSLLSSSVRWSRHNVLAMDVDCTAWSEDWRELGERLTWTDYLPTLRRLGGTHRWEGAWSNGWTASGLLSMATGPNFHLLHQTSGTDLGPSGSISGQIARQLTQRIRCRADLLYSVGSSEYRRMGVGWSMALTSKVSLDAYGAGVIDAGSNSNSSRGGLAFVHPHGHLSISYWINPSAVITTLISSQKAIIWSWQWQHQRYPGSISLHTNWRGSNNEYGTTMISAGIEGKMMWKVDRWNSLKFKLSSFSSSGQLSIGLIRKLQSYHGNDDNDDGDDDDESDNENEGKPIRVAIPKVGCTVEASTQWGVGLKLSYAPDEETTIVLPFYLNRQLSQHSLLWGIALPSLIAFFVNNLILLPWQRRRRRKFWLQFHQEQKYRMQQQREEAQLAIDMMMEYLEKHPPLLTGLIIKRAIYQVAPEEQAEIKEPEWNQPWEVTAPLQLLVNDDQVQLEHCRTFALLLGFYDPAPGLVKILRIEYEFKRQKHVAILRDGQAIYLPQKAHLITTTNLTTTLS